MLKKTITFVDYNGVERTEDYFFNLNEAELTEMELSEDGGLVSTIEKIVKEEDGKEIVRLFKLLLLSAVGIKSEDGRRFIKNDKIREEFEQTEAYSKLFVELATTADKASAFVNGILPKTVRNQPPQKPQS